MRAILTAALVAMSSAAFAQSVPQRAPTLDQFSAQATVRCPQGQVYDERSRACVVPQFDNTGMYVGGAIIGAGAVAAILLANKGNKSVSP